MDNYIEYTPTQVDTLIHLLLFIINITIAIHVIFSPYYFLNYQMTKNIENPHIKLLVDILSIGIGLFAIVLCSILTLPYSMLIILRTIYYDLIIPFIKRLKEA